MDLPQKSWISSKADGFIAGNTAGTSQQLALTNGFWAAVPASAASFGSLVAPLSEFGAQVWDIASHIGVKTYIWNVAVDKLGKEIRNLKVNLQGIWVTIRLELTNHS